MLGKRIIPTRLRGNVTIREENAAAALEVISRFAADPRWLIYLPPTMSPCATSGESGLLEHSSEALLMPWSAKAQELLRTQYAAVGSAGSASLPRAVAALERAAGRLDGSERDSLLRVEASYHLRARTSAGYDRGAWAGSGRWRSASLPWASRRWSGSSAASRYGGSTNASSRYSPWRASRWTRGCRRGDEHLVDKANASSRDRPEEEVVDVRHDFVYIFEYTSAARLPTDEKSVHEGSRGGSIKAGKGWTHV